MNFDDFLNQGWADHARDASGVAQRLGDGTSLITKAEEIPPFAGLVTHVFGEHLGRWADGITSLERLTTLPCFVPGAECDKAVRRSIASLELASGDRKSLDSFSISDRIRILAVSASALSEQKKSSEAAVLFHEALSLAESGLAKEDPANRSLAVTGNGLASALEERASLSAADTELMLLAARSARKYWEIAGGWLQVERAEYRLAQSHLKAGDHAGAMAHAKKCLAICEENQAPALEFFFGYEAIAKIEKSRGDRARLETARGHMKTHFDRLSVDDQSWCRQTLTET